jgi:3-oxoacyl-[acyl-carrier protein] reductase
MAGPSPAHAAVPTADSLRDLFRLDGRVAVVTGAASGIGRGAALTFSAAGASVLIADIDQAGLAATAETITKNGGKAEAHVCDVRDRAAVHALADRAVAGAGRLDVWANVAGVLRPRPIVDTTEEDLDATLAVNLKGVYWGCAAAAKAMIPRGAGSIINIASAGADVPAPGLSAYSLTKAAVIMLTKTLATEVGQHGVRANAVAPGFIDTPMVAHHFTREDGSVDSAARDAIFKSRAAQTPLGTTGEPSDIALAMLYLASDAARFVTGQTLRPNGGVAMP